jgi:hypothetical protein
MDDWSSIPGRDKSVQTGSVAYLASYPVETGGSFLVDKASGA